MDIISPSNVLKFDEFTYVWNPKSGMQMNIVHNLNQSHDYVVHENAIVPSLSNYIFWTNLMFIFVPVILFFDWMARQNYL